MPACAEISPMLRGLSPVGGKPIVARFDTEHLCSDGKRWNIRMEEHFSGKVVLQGEGASFSEAWPFFPDDEEGL